MDVNGWAVPVPLQAPPKVVIDTNVVLDMLVFHNPLQADLLNAIDRRQIDWVASQRMLDELDFVLRRPNLLPWFQKAGVSRTECLAFAMTRVRRFPVSPPCGFRCKDPSDQCFIDLAVDTKSGLVSKDKAVLRLASRLARVGVAVGPSLALAMRLTNPYPIPMGPAVPTT